MATLMGWREWASLPGLGVDRVKVKVDTGARTSALHATQVTLKEINGEQWVSFKVLPMQGNSEVVLTCEHPVFEHRTIRDSGGHEEERVIIKTPVSVGTDQWDIELSLTDRETMGFRMLLGRNAIRTRYFVDPTSSFILTSPADGSEEQE